MDTVTLLVAPVVVVPVVLLRLADLGLTFWVVTEDLELLALGFCTPG